MHNAKSNSTPRIASGSILLMKNPTTWIAMLTLAFAAPSFAAPEVVSVWPSGKMPGNGAKEAEKEAPSKGDGVVRLTNVSEPTMTVYPAPSAQKPAPAVIICPGGGYQILAINKEGSAIAAWLNTQGITGIVLKYRVPQNREGALQDLQRAVRLTRSKHKDWNIDATRIGVMGFSAGGHLCARLVTNHGTAFYPPIDDADKLPDRPDFAVLVYPAYLDRQNHLAADLPVSANIPATFIVHSDDDKSFIAGSKFFAEALTKAKVEHEFALYPTGGHGYGLHSKGEAKAWPGRCEQWLERMKVRAK
jgi:acetyl esterase/lipase